jgi:hypothetical protein
MRVRIFFLGLVFIISCTGKKNDPNKNQRSMDSMSQDSILKVVQNRDLDDPQETDSILFDSVKINDKIPLKLTIKSLLKHLGQPDSIKTEEWECGNYLNDQNSVDVYYYGKSRFITSKGEALLHILYPSDSKLFFGTNDFKISNEITEFELMSLFPKSYDRMIYRIKNDEHYGPRRLVVEMIDQPLYQDGSGFIFYIENEKLTRIELWWFIC